MTKNIFSYKQKGGITADKVSLNGSDINNPKNLSAAEGAWTKLGVIAGIITMLLAVLAFFIKSKI